MKHFMRPKNEVQTSTVGPDSSVNAPLVTFSCVVGLQGWNPTQSSGTEHLAPF